LFLDDVRQEFVARGLMYDFWDAGSHFANSLRFMCPEISSVGCINFQRADW
jgi:hypothetical protein